MLKTNRRGAALVIVALSMVALLGVTALAVDVGMMYSARGEAQRVADAAALAGASAFLDYNPPSAAFTPARVRAQDYVTANYIMNAMVDTSEAAIDVNTVAQQVTVTVRRDGIATWFARIFGVHNVAVSAFATAEATNAGGARCVRPWAIQDLWHEEKNGVEVVASTGDKFGDSATDRYEPVPLDNFDDPRATGYGSIAHTATNRDLGSVITLKAQLPQQNPNTGQNQIAQPGPGEFLIWDMPDDPNQASCPSNAVTQDYPQNICSCNNNLIEIGVDYPLAFGNKVGPGDHGLKALVDQDLTARWDPSTNTVVGSKFADWHESPRVVPIALMAPLGPPPGQNWNPSALNTVRFTTFALMFIEDYNKGNSPGQPDITGRFLYYAKGEKGPTAGPTVKYLRLVR
ncbi:MAG TPA: pilus assembly protein TadG-related protein [Longimicrobiales bacterium]